MARLTFVFDTPIAYDPTFPGFVAEELARKIAQRTVNGSLPVEVVEASIQCDFHDREVHAALRAEALAAVAEEEAVEVPDEEPVAEVPED